MPRPQRLEYNGAWYHVMNRGRGRQAIFHAREYYQAFLQTLEEAHQRFGIEVHAYCLMSNHYHLLMNTPRGNLSRCMRHINGLYTQRHNRLRNTDGPLFRGRFKAILVDQDAYLLALTRYIHRNPIEVAKPVVKTLSAHRWSSYPAYINKATSPSWLFREETYAMLNMRQRYAGYQRYVERGTDEELSDFYAKAHLAPILGTKRFQERAVQRDLKNLSERQLRRRAFAQPSIEQIVRAVAEHYDVVAHEIRQSRRGERNEARWVAMHLCQTLGDHSLSVLAEAFGVSHVSGVSKQIGRLKDEMATDRALRVRVERLFAALNK